MSTSNYSFAVLLACAAMYAPADALAHAELVKSEPTNNGSLAAATREVTFTFSEEIKPVSCSLTTASGETVSGLGKPDAQGMVLHIPVEKIPQAGAYKLACRVVGPDGHPINSTISFNIGAASEK